MGKITGTDIRNLERTITRFIVRASKLEQKIHHATTEQTHEAAVNAWENQQELIREARLIIANYYGLNAQKAVR
jgi:hypothetical protein